MINQTWDYNIDIVVPGYFQIKTRQTDAVGLTTVQLTILLQKLCHSMHGNKHVDMLS